MPIWRYFLLGLLGFWIGVIRGGTSIDASTHEVTFVEEYLTLRLGGHNVRSVHTLKFASVINKRHRLPLNLD